MASKSKNTFHLLWTTWYRSECINDAPELVSL